MKTFFVIEFKKKILLLAKVLFQNITFIMKQFRDINMLLIKKFKTEGIIVLLTVLFRCMKSFDYFLKDCGKNLTKNRMI